MPIMEELKNAFYALITGIGPTVEFMRELVEQTRKGEGPLANFASIIINSAKYAEELVAVFIGLKVVSVLSAAATCTGLTRDLPVLYELRDPTSNLVHREQARNLANLREQDSGA